MGLFGNAGIGQASSAYKSAVNTAGMLGNEAQGIGSSLTPFLTEEMLHPQGYGQQGLSAMTAAAEGGAGGATAGLTGQAMQRAAASHNTGAYQAALDAASRNRSQAEAGSSEGIAARNAGLQQEQAQQGASGLGGMYRTDTSGMLNAMGQESQDVNAESNAIKAGSPILNGMSSLIQDAGGIAKLAGGFGIPGFGGFAPSNASGGGR